MIQTSLKKIVVIYLLGIFEFKSSTSSTMFHLPNTIKTFGITNGHTTLTMFDNIGLRSYFHIFRNFVFRNIGRTSSKTRGHFLQNPFSQTASFPCGLNNSRSFPKPNSVHKLRPGDIDVIAAMGDSLTAGSGAASSSFFDLFMENRGLAWSIGGQYNWRNVTTLPNILKVYNPKLLGYSRHDSFPFHVDSQFNVAEIGAVSADLPFMAKVLVQRIKNDSRINFEKSWKMVSICMGGNDFCTFICTMKNPELLPKWHRSNMLKALRYLRDNLPSFKFNAFFRLGGNDFCTFICTMKNPELLPKWHRSNMLKALRYLRDNLPRTFVNVITEPPPHKVVSMKTHSKSCRTINHLECSCFVGNLFKPNQRTLERYHKIHDEFSRVEEEVTRLSEFRNLTDFTVIFQPFTRNLSIIDEYGKPDYSLLAYDCFHISQKGNAWAGTTLWNSLLEADGKKEKTWSSPHKKFLCPTKENPYFLTYDNSRLHS